MTSIFTVSPDFTPDHLSGWFIFNTWLQKAMDMHLHLQLYDDFDSLHRAVASDEIDLIYANPYDAAMLVRDKGFKPLVKPEGKADEALIAVSESSSFKSVEDLRPGARIATTGDPDVHLMGMIMLEPADLDAGSVSLKHCESYVLVAKELIKGTADAGIFLLEAFQDMASVTRSRLRVLVKSQIHVVHHALMIGPRLAEHRERMVQVLTDMHNCEKGAGVLAELAFPRWEAVDDEDMEFMIDLMDALNT